MVEINTSAQPQLVDIYTFLKNEFEGTLPFLDSLHSLHHRCYAMLNCPKMEERLQIRFREKCNYSALDTLLRMT